MRLRPLVLELEYVLAVGRIRHQQLGACVYHACTALRERLTPPTNSPPNTELL